MPKLEESAGRAPRLAPAIRELLEVITREDPKLALRIVNGAAPDALTRYALAAVVARTWGATCPREAWQWARTNGAEWNFPEQRSLQAWVWEGMAQSAPELVVETATSALAALSSANNSGREDLAHEAVHALLLAGADSVAEQALTRWSSLLPVDRLSSGAVGLVSANAAATSPEAALRWLNTLPPSPARNDGFVMLAAKWAETAPESAIAWAAGVSTEQGRIAVVQGAFTSWLRTDLVGCVGWLAENEADPACDHLITDLVSNPKFRTENPGAAVQLAAAISDSTARLHVLPAAILSWAEQNEAAAKEYLRTTHRLPEVKKAEILHALSARSTTGYY